MSRPRRPAVAGRFYPAQPERLAAEVARYMPPAASRKVIASVGPHAGYMYSGAILGETYACVDVPARVIILCPNHTGMGVARSLWSGGAWEIPGGAIEVDAELARSVALHADLTPDREAHLHEHAIEVHLPFLRARREDVRIVPIVLSGLDIAGCRGVGHGIATAIRDAGTDVLVAASTDMSHYISAQDADRLDNLALDRVRALDPEGLHSTVRQHSISMCGYIPTTVALFAARELGAEQVELVRYGNSGDASGDYNRVVGYAGLTIH